MIRQFSHIFLVEGLTFISVSKSQTRALEGLLSKPISACASTTGPPPCATEACCEWLRATMPWIEPVSVDQKGDKAFLILAMGLCLLKSHRDGFVTDGKDLRTVWRNRHRVLPMSGKTPVFGTNGPPIRIDFGVTSPDVEHRFDAERHSGFELQSLPRCPVVGDLGLFVHLTSDSVPDVLFDDPIAIGLTDRMNGRPDITETIGLADLVNAGPQPLLRRVDQVLGFGGDLPDADGGTG